MDNYHTLCKEYLEKIKPLLNGRSDLEYDTLVKLCGTGDAVTMADVKYRCEALFKKLQGSNAPDIEIVYVETGNDCSNLRQQNQVLMDKLTTMKNTLDDTMIKQVAELTASKNQTEEQKKINAKLTNNVTMFRNQINQLQDEINQLQNEFNTTKINTQRLSVLQASVNELKDVNTKLNAQIAEAKKLQLDAEKKLKIANLENGFNQSKITKMTLWNTEKQDKISNILEENKKLQSDLNKTKMENMQYADKQIIWELKYNDLKNTENILKLQRNALQDYENIQKELWDQITDIRSARTEDMQSYINLPEVTNSLSKSSFKKFNEDLTKMDKLDINKLIDTTVEYLNAMPSVTDNVDPLVKLLSEFMEVSGKIKTDVNTILKIKYFVAVFQMNRDALIKYRNDHKNAFPPNASPSSESTALEELEKDGYAGMMMTTEKYLHTNNIAEITPKEYTHNRIEIEDSELKDYKSDGFLEQYIKLRTYLVTNVVDMLDEKKRERERYAGIFQHVLSQTKNFIEILSNDNDTRIKLTNILSRDTLFYYINEILNNPYSNNDLLMLYHAISFCKSESENVKEISQSRFLNKLIAFGVTKKKDEEEDEEEEEEEEDEEEEEEEDEYAVIRIHKGYKEHKTKLDNKYIYMIDNGDEHTGEIALYFTNDDIDMNDGVLKLDKDIATKHINDVLETKDLGEIRKKMTKLLLNEQSNLKPVTYGGYDNVVSQYDGVAFGGVIGGAILFSENAVTVLMVTCILLLMYLIHILYYQPCSGYKNRSKCGRGSLQNTEAIQYMAY